MYTVSTATNENNAKSKKKMCSCIDITVGKTQFRHLYAIPREMSRQPGEKGGVKERGRERSHPQGKCVAATMNKKRNCKYS